MKYVTLKVHLFMKLMALRSGWRFHGVDHSLFETSKGMANFSLPSSATRVTEVKRAVVFDRDNLKRAGIGRRTFPPHQTVCLDPGFSSEGRHSPTTQSF